MPPNQIHQGSWPLLDWVLDFAVLALVFVLLVQPSARNRALLKCVALVSVVALLFPLQLAYAIALPAVVLALWLVWRAVFWPLYWLEDVLRRCDRR